MRDVTVARNYAETLFTLAERHEGIEVYERGIEVVVRLLDEVPGFRLFLETPRIGASQKKEVLRKVLGEVVPKNLLYFLLVTLDKRRQRLLRDIAREYHSLVDDHHGRTHVEVTVARELSDESIQEITKRLSKLLGRTAIPHVRVKPHILGGVLVRAGDTIYDGTLRRRMESMRRGLLTAELPGGVLPTAESTS